MFYVRQNEMETLLMTIAIVVPTYNRIEYTKLTLERLLSDTTEDFDLYIWDNGSTDLTKQYLLDELRDPRIVEVITNEENVGQTGAMNYVWSKTKADLVGKLDNDCLVTPGWSRVFEKAHKDISRLGAVAMWHFPVNMFDGASAQKAKKIQTFGEHQIVRHPWVCGSGFIMKRETYLKYGPWESGRHVGTTQYFLRMALGGEINGWYYPLIWQEHMDNPLSSYTKLKDDKSIAENFEITYSLKFKNIRTLKERVEMGDKVLRSICGGPWDAKYYVGIRNKIRHIQTKFLQKLKLNR
jgi:glycosyltransferase involved in cell wall biosynthesis